MTHRKGYWKGKARAGRYAELWSAGATKRDAKKYSVSRFHLKLYYEFVAISEAVRENINKQIWGDGGPQRELLGLRSLFASELSL